MMKKFEQDECLLMAICQEDTCEQTKEEMKKILPFLKHDTEMTALVKGANRTASFSPFTSFNRLNTAWLYRYV